MYNLIHEQKSRADCFISRRIIKVEYVGTGKTFFLEIGLESADYSYGGGWCVEPGYQ